MMIRGGAGGEFNRQLLFIAVIMTCLYAEQSSRKGNSEKEHAEMEGDWEAVEITGAKAFDRLEKMRFKAK